MSEDAPVTRRSAPRADVHRAAVRRMLGTSLICLAAQSSLTDYGTGGPGAAVFWFLIGGLLLWLVARQGSRAARGVIVVTSLLGAVVYAVIAFGGDVRAAVVALLFVGQAVPLLTRPVREHVAGTR